MFVSDRPADAAAAIPIRVVSPDQFERWRIDATEFQRNFTAAGPFRARPDSALLVPGPDGRLAEVLVGRAEHAALWTLACLPGMLPTGDYRIEGEPDSALESLALGWALGHYRYDRYKPAERPGCLLRIPEALRARIESHRDAWFRVRDLVNTPASDLGPAELADVATELAERLGAAYEVIEGGRLEREFPAIHAVGRASSRAPRLIRMEWGDRSHRSLALVGKGVVFDTGGLDIKPSAGMLLMKKDMGGAAHVLGLAELIMRTGLPVHLRVYIPAVENSISGNAYRPSDILRTRNGTTVEIGNTDAEGRVVLSDALTLAAEEGAERIIDFATLTGAARVALGEDLPPLYARNQAQARTIQDLSFELGDPLWQMPLYRPYKSQIQPKIADLSNSGTSSFGGSLTAALFLDHFVPAGIDWMHLDVYAWNLGDRPGRPAGGEAQGLRTMLAWLEREYRG
jgi:leucyl aminopeptidase